MNRKIGIDNVRMFLAALVVFNHGEWLRESTPMLGDILHTSIFRLGTPVFLLISGYFFYKVSLKTPEHVRAWIVKLLVLFLMWSVIYFPSAFVRWKSGQLDNLFLTMLVGYWHLWYLPAAAGGALVLYLVRHWTSRTLIAAMSVAYLAGLLIEYGGFFDWYTPLLNELFDNSIFYRNFLLFGFPMVGLGYLIARTRIDACVERKSILGLLLLGTVVMLLEIGLTTHFLPDNYADVKLLVSVPILAAGIFLMAATSRTNFAIPYGVAVATTVYFIHPAWLIVWRRLGNFSGSTAPTVLALLCAVATGYAVAAYKNRHALVRGAPKTLSNGASESSN